MVTLHDVLAYAKQLSVIERKELIKFLLDSIDTEAQDTEEQEEESILFFAGVARHLTDSEDPQVAINRLRDEWHNP